jgi:hypothetical protein
MEGPEAEANDGRHVTTPVPAAASSVRSGFTAETGGEGRTSVGRGNDYDRGVADKNAKEKAKTNAFELAMMMELRQKLLLLDERLIQVTIPAEVTELLRIARNWVALYLQLLQSILTEIFQTKAARSLVVSLPLADPVTTRRIRKLSWMTSRTG